MFYFKFIGWLIRKADRLETKLFYGDAGVYNHFDKDAAYRVGILRTIIAFIFIGIPIVGYVFLVSVLPIPENIQWLILVATALIAFIITAKVLVYNARR